MIKVIILPNKSSNMMGFSHMKPIQYNGMPAARMSALIPVSVGFCLAVRKIRNIQTKRNMTGNMRFTLGY